MDSITRKCRKCGNEFSGERCKACSKVYAAKWRAVNPGKIEAWQADNPDRVKAASDKWRANNREKLNAYAAKQRKENPEKARAKDAKWRIANLEKARAADAKWRTEHPEQKRANNQNRRARIKGNGGKYTATEWEALKQKYGHKCLDCGEVKSLTIDHVVPIVAGGLNTIDNIQPLCLSCNSKKHAKTTDFR